MHIEINNYTGHESNCEINYYDIKGDYVYSLILEDLKTELYVNITMTFLKPVKFTHQNHIKLQKLKKKCQTALIGNLGNKKNQQMLMTFS